MKRLFFTSSMLASLAAAQAAHLRYVNDIFNQIHDSMRQFGSSLHHNGMGAFLATVPEATDFYHGTFHADRVNDTEWLAFEPEHALMFARGQRRRHPPPNGPPPPDMNRISSQEWVSWSSDQKLLTNDNDDHVDDHGYLHTYRTKHSLRLLYLDGQSAAKSDKGTLDLQDIVLLENKLSSAADGKPPRNPGLAEGRRAELLCKLAHDDWHGRVDGFLRMEAGFEIILCDFAKHLDLVRVVQARTVDGPQPLEPSEDGFNYFQAVASRFEAIGGGRAILDYDDYISLFAVQDLLYIDAFVRPRINASSVHLPAVRDSIRDMVFREHAADSINWQQVTDMVVVRFVNNIEYLASDLIKDLAQLRAKVESLLRPFIDYSHRNESNEVARCVESMVNSRARSRQTLASRAILSVTQNVCETTLSLTRAESIDAARRVMTDLKQNLGWSEWERCRNCSVHELCFLPIWPFGSGGDLARPRCLSNATQAGHDYW